MTVESQRGGVQAGVTAQHMGKTWNTMMEEGEQIKPTCMCVHTVLVHLSTIWGKSKKERKWMLVQRHTRLVVGMSSVTKGGWGLNTNPLEIIASQKIVRNFWCTSFHQSLKLQS